MWIIANALLQAKKMSSELLNQDKNMLWDWKYHKAAIMFTDRGLDIVH